MSGTFIEIKMTGDDVFRVFRNVAKEAALPVPMLDSVGAYLKSELQLRARKEQAPDGTQWLRSKRAEEERGVTLIDSGSLIDDSTWNVSGNELTFGLTQEYGAIHQFGGPAGRNHSVEMPKREMIGIAPIQQAGIDKILLSWTSRWFS